MEKIKKNLAQYLLAGIVSFFGGRTAEATTATNTTPEQNPITAPNNTTTNKPAFAEVSLPKNTPTNKVTAVTIDPTVALDQGRNLYDQAKGLLCLNEGCRTNCYRCSEHKVTLGIGSNLQDFSFVLRCLNLPLIRPKEDGRREALMGDKRDQLCTQFASMTDEEIEKITMLPKHAEQLSRETYAYFYEKMAQRFAKTAPEYVSLKGKTTKTSKMLSGIDFSTLPLYLKVAIMDTAYQLGEKKFNKYHLFETALRQGDYMKAFQELAVNQTSQTTKHFKNPGLARRGFRKDFLGFAYMISKNYPKLTDKAFVIALANVAHSKVTAKTYNGAINQVEKDAAFKHALPFIMQQFHPNLTKEEAAAKQAELTTLWKQTQKNLKQQKTAPQKASKQQGTAK